MLMPRSLISTRFAATPLLLLLSLFVVSAPSPALSQPTSSPNTERLSTNIVPAGSSTSASGTRSSLKCPLKPSSPGLARRTTSGLLCHEDAVGQWFPLPAARLMLQDLKAGKAALELQPKLEQRIELEKKRVELLELDVKTSDKIAEQWKQAAETQAKVLAKGRSFWRSPPLWFAVGVVVTAGGFATAMRFAR